MRIVLVGLFLYSATLAVEEWSWTRDGRLEMLNKNNDEGILSDDNGISLCFC